MQLLDIYGPRGKARDYAELAHNPYDGCPHGCKYCYVPCFAKGISREAFHSVIQVRPDCLARFEHDCSILQAAGNRDLIHLSFMCDPYPLGHTEPSLIREMICIAHKHDQFVDILAKNGTDPMYDLDVLTPGDRIGVTLTCLTEQHRQWWEPGASSTDERIGLLQAAHALGIPTRVSFEPVVYASHTLELIRRVRSFTDLIQVGKLNPRRGMHLGVWECAQRTDWRKFHGHVCELLGGMAGDWMLKRDLIEAAEAA